MLRENQSVEELTIGFKRAIFREELGVTKEMGNMRKILTGLVFVAIFTFALQAAAWKPGGGAIWKKRTGFGLIAGIGSVMLTDDYYDDHWDQEFFGSIGATIGVFYRLSPMVVFFIDFNTTYLRLDSSHYDDDRGVLAQVTGGAEFHFPIIGWLDAYVGGGIGHAFVLANGERDRPHQNDDEFTFRAHALNFEMRTGATLYFFSKAPKLGLGPYFRLGIPLWLRACVDGDNMEESCASRDDFDEPEIGIDEDDLPFIFHFGGELRYTF